MTIRPLMDGLFIIPGLVNVYLLETLDGYALIDTGFPGSADKILKNIRSLGKAPKDIRHILLTHAHPDHIGSVAALQRATGAMVYAHTIDMPIIEAGSGFRPIVASPGLRNKIVTRVIRSLISPVEPTKVDQRISEDKPLNFLPDLTPIHIPGHCAGQLAFLWNRNGGILFAADACINRRGLLLTAAVESLDEAHRSLAKLAGLSFEVACFGHGPPICRGADASFRRKWLGTSSRAQ